MGTPGSQAPYTAEVKETYTHGGVEGRASARATDFFIGGTQTAGFTQTFAYDPLGEVASLGYPECDGCGAESPRTVAFSRSPGDAHPFRRGRVFGRRRGSDRPRGRRGLRRRSRWLLGFAARPAVSTVVSTPT